MPRMIQITLPSGAVAGFLRDVEALECVISLKHQKGVSLRPPGDVVTVVTTNRDLPSLMRLLDRHQIGRDPATSASVDRPQALLSSPFRRRIDEDTSDAPWEEVESELAKESNMTANALWVMAIAGALAAVGLLTNSLHIVIGAMVIAPGFEPFTRVSLGLVAGGGVWKKGARDAVVGYAALIAGAMATSALLSVVVQAQGATASSYLPGAGLIPYWASVSCSSVLVTIVASAAGAILISSNRAVLTSGVMIALALIPAAALFGIGLVKGDLGLAARGLIRLSVEVALVVGVSAAVLLWQKRRRWNRTIT